MKITQVLSGATQLGKEIKLSPKTVVLLNKENFTLQFDEESVMVRLGIGDEEAFLVMSVKAFDKIKDTEVIGQTIKQFRKGFLK